MKRQILALLLCICMAATGFVYAFADEELPGDANGDGTVTAADAALVMRYAAGYDYWRLSTRNKMLADVNHDGAMNEKDAAAILRQVIRLETLTPITTDASLLELLNKQAVLYDDDMTEWAAQFIQSLPENSDARAVLYAAAQYLGTPYGTGTGQLDCSGLLKIAFKDAKISTKVYPQKNSDGTLTWFRTYHPEQLHETDDYSWQDWKPGCVLIYVNAETGKGSHLALYVGEINGSPIVIESRRNPVDGARIGYLMGSSSSWDLQYYVDPLG